MTIDKKVTLHLVKMDELPEEKRDETAKMAALNYLLGRKCAHCNFSYETENDIKEHGCIGGYNDDIVGKDCWVKYLEKNEN